MTLKTSEPKLNARHEGVFRYVQISLMPTMPVRLKTLSQCVPRLSRLPSLHKLSDRLQSSVSSTRNSRIQAHVEPPITRRGPPALSIMPTKLLLRSLMVTSILSSPRLLKICLPVMTHLANSKSVLLNPDKNRLVSGIMRILFYNHFCAGSSELEVRKTVSTMKDMGFKGVILGYAKEVIVDPGATREEAAGSGSAKLIEGAIDQWREGNLRSLPMIGTGDFLAVK